MTEAGSEAANPVPTSSEASHEHTISSDDRAAVVGKCLTEATTADEEVEVLVDIAG